MDVDWGLPEIEKFSVWPKGKGRSVSSLTKGSCIDQGELQLSASFPTAQTSLSVVLQHLLLQEPPWSNRSLGFFMQNYQETLWHSWRPALHNTSTRTSPQGPAFCFSSHFGKPRSLWRSLPHTSPMRQAARCTPRRFAPLLDQNRTTRDRTKKEICVC